MSECPFCQPDRKIILSSELSICFYDKYPVSTGQMLVVPKRHVPDYFELNEAEKSDIWQLAEHWGS